MDLRTYCTAALTAYSVPIYCDSPCASVHCLSRRRRTAASPAFICMSLRAQVKLAYAHGLTARCAVGHEGRALQLDKKELPLARQTSRCQARACLFAWRVAVARPCNTVLFIFKWFPGHLNYLPLPSGCRLATSPGPQPHRYFITSRSGRAVPDL